MSKVGRNFEQLEMAFRELGLANAASWARSEIEEDIPQLPTALFLKGACVPIDDLQDIRKLREIMLHTGGRETAEALRRLIDTGASANDILEVIRTMLRSYLTELCFLLDDSSSRLLSGWQTLAEREKINWGLFCTDDQGRPGAQMAGLHEVVGEFIGK